MSSKKRPISDNIVSHRIGIGRAMSSGEIMQQSDDQSGKASSSGANEGAAPLSRYESQKRRDWNTFGQYLKNHNPPVSLSECNFNHVLEFLRYLDQFGKTKVHSHACVFFGQPDPPAPCTCPLRQAWGSLDALIGRLRAAYEEHGGSPESNPFGSGAIRVYLREVKECQAKARGIPYTKKKKKNKNKNKNKNKIIINKTSTPIHAPSNSHHQPNPNSFNPHHLPS